MGFAHLHTHSYYSLLDGFNAPEVLAERAADAGHKALALTDHGNIHAFLRHYKACKKHDIKPIIGCEFYITSTFSNDGLSKEEDTYHLVVLAKNDEGLNNIFQLVTLSNTEGFYYKPRISFEMLKEHQEGLIVSSACLGGEVAKKILNNDMDAATKIAKEYKKIFGDDYYLELMPTGTKKQYIANARKHDISKELDIDTIATVDMHYLNEEDANAQDILLAVNTGSTLDDEDRFTFDCQEYYFKDRQEIADGLFRGHKHLDVAERACDNTLEIADKIEEYHIDTEDMKLPIYELSEGEDFDSELRKKCYQELYSLVLSKDIDMEEYIERLEHELNIISMKGYSKYFLVTAELMQWAHNNSIVSGPGRGSAGGCLISYLLEIIKIDPLDYDLLFSRFLNPERESYPDIDIDISKAQRSDMIQHMKNKYGEDKVSHICTFDNMATKSSLKDVGRVLNIDYHIMNDQISKQVPDEADSVKEALELSDELKEYEKQYPKLFKYAMQVEDKPRGLGTHASALVATPDAITNYTPLAKPKSSSKIDYVTQTEMHDTEELGMLKFDFLGLEALDIIKDTIDSINKRDDLDKFDYIPDIDNIWEEIPLDDKEVYKNIYSKADNNGVFQVSSYLFSDILKRMKPSKFEHIIALVALGRPGPINSGIVDKYIDRMKGKKEVTYPHESLEEHLEETYGLMIYQENVMRVAREVAGFSLGEADILRRAIGKKKADVMEEVKKKFINGCKDNGHTEDFAINLFNQIEEFADYAFNKSHSASYALISYCTAYLKHYFPSEFYAALMTAEAKKSSSESSLNEFVSDCYQRDIKVLPPDVNESDINFTAIADDKIRYGLNSIKHVGGKAINSIIENKPYSSFKDFFRKVNKSKVNKRVFEALIKAGAFDKLNENRKELFDEYQRLRKNGADQMTLFADDDLRPDITTHKKDIIEMEIEVLGSSVTYPSKFDLAQDGQIVEVEGEVITVKEIYDKNDNLMAFVDLETEINEITLVVFNDQYVGQDDYFESGFRLKVKGKKSDDSILLNKVELSEGDLYSKAG